MKLYRLVLEIEDEETGEVEIQESPFYNKKSDLFEALEATKEVWRKHGLGEIPEELLEIETYNIPEMFWSILYSTEYCELGDDDNKNCQFN